MTQFFGVFHAKPDARYGQIAVLGRTDGTPMEAVSEFPPRGRVFCPNLPDFLPSQPGLFVTFEREPSQKRDPSPNDDLFLANPRSIIPFGAQVLAVPEEEWSGIPPRFAAENHKAPDRQTVYIRTTWKHRPAVVGPWKSSGALWIPKENGRLWHWLPPAFPRTLSNDGWEYVPSPLPKGEHILDASDADSLVKWWKKQLRGIDEYRTIMDRLDRDIHGWTDALKKLLSESQDGANAQLNRQKLGKIISLFDQFEWREEEWRRLLRSDAGQAALAHCIRTRVDEWEPQARNRLEEHLAETKAELARIQNSLDDKRLELEDVDRKLEAVRETSEHLRGERTRLLRDAALLRELLGDAPSSSATSSPSAPGRVAARPAADDGEDVWAPALTVLAEPAVLNSDAFVTNRLAPVLGAWEPEARKTDACNFHAVLLSCRAVRVPHVGWTRAYKEAIGATAEMAVIVGSPQWSTFHDVWRAGLGCVWCAAECHTDRLFLLHVRELALSFADAWIHPLLDLLSGHASALPVAGRPGWPDNLRLCWSEGGVANRDRFSLSDEVIAHFPVLRATGGYQFSEPQQLGGAVVVEPWRRWKGVPAGESVDFSEFNTRPPGSTDRLVREDTRRIAVRLAELAGKNRASGEYLKDALDLRWPAWRTESFGTALA
ncbi:MAG: hypothetical protein LBU64_11830 [Planctomycetota bacterium]|jgi:hypothetical protein|nr:hypothetical protein [Planctomycetota bacterium]